jgi:hypothetical protein
VNGKEGKRSRRLGLRYLGLARGSGAEKRQTTDVSWIKDVDLRIDDLVKKT